MASEGTKYSPQAVTKRMKLAEIRAMRWFDKCIDVADGTGTDEAVLVKLEMIKSRVENLAPWRYGAGDPDELFSALESPAIDA